jgi:hypothetical protein
MNLCFRCGVYFLFCQYKLTNDLFLLMQKHPLQLLVWKLLANNYLSMLIRHGFIGLNTTANVSQLLIVKQTWHVPEFSLGFLAFIWQLEKYTREIYLGGGGI